MNGVIFLHSTCFKLTLFNSFHSSDIKNKFGTVNFRAKERHSLLFNLNIKQTTKYTYTMKKYIWHQN